ncbi:MAG: DUF5518 domain-containing protein [Pyrobaculum sp.]
MNLATAVVIGFLLNVATFFIAPAFNELIGGFAAGYLAGGSLARAVLAGFLAGVLGGVILSAVVLALALAITPLLSSLIGPFAALIPLVALVPLFLGLKGALLSAIGGLLGGVVRQYVAPFFKSQKTPGG